MPSAVLEQPQQFTDPRDRFIHRVASGRTFADVGGLWGTVSEKTSVAHAAGASSLTMIDQLPAGDEWWQKFEERCRELHLPEVRAVVGEVVKLAQEDPALRFDVVHCSGVLYHFAEPLAMIRALRALTREYLILSSSITETVIENHAGTIRVPEGGAIFVPALTRAERAVMHAHWSPTVGNTAIGLTSPVDRWDIDDFAPWWWLPTTTALGRMCEVAGFEVEALDHFWNSHAATLLLRAVR